MAIIDVVRWAPQSDSTIFAYRYPKTSLSTMTQLIVYESQVAVLLSQGQLLGKFGPGRHQLSTENLPVLRTLYGIPFGGKNPFTAEVWFVNLTQTFSIDWEALNIPIHDGDYDSYLPLEASGQYGLKVLEPEKFLIKVVGTRHEFDQEQMTEQFQGEVSTKVKSAIVRFMLNNNIGYKQISAYLDQLSTFLRDSLDEFWRNLGLELTKFYVADVDIDTSTPEGMRVKESLARQTSQRITGHTWQQQEMFDTANRTIDQMGNMASGFGGNSQGGLLGGLLAINMMNSMTRGALGGSTGENLMHNDYNQPSFGDNGNRHARTAGDHGNRQVYCGNCSRKYPATSTFCPYCGHRYRPCPVCGSDNDDSARRCVKCGTSLNDTTDTPVCEKCGEILQPGTAFCPKCGTKVSKSSSYSPIGSTACSRCGEMLPPGVKFCPRCGMSTKS